MEMSIMKTLRKVFMLSFAILFTNQMLAVAGKARGVSCKVDADCQSGLLCRPMTGSTYPTVMDVTNIDNLTGPLVCAAPFSINSVECYSSDECRKPNVNARSYSCKSYFTSSAQLKPQNPVGTCVTLRSKFGLQ